MSNFIRMTKHPKDKIFQVAVWLDNHFGRHHYGVQFPDGTIFNENDFVWEFDDEWDFSKSQEK